MWQRLFNIEVWIENIGGIDMDIFYAKNMNILLIFCRFIEQTHAMW